MLVVLTFLVNVYNADVWNKYCDVRFYDGVIFFLKCESSLRMDLVPVLHVHASSVTSWASLFLLHNLTKGKNGFASPHRVYWPSQFFVWDLDWIILSFVLRINLYKLKDTLKLFFQLF